jgi:hypothetical protein
MDPLVLAVSALSAAMAPLTAAKAVLAAAVVPSQFFSVRKLVITHFMEGRND